MGKSKKKVDSRPKHVFTPSMEDHAKALKNTINKAKMYLLKDEKSNSYGYPFTAKTRGLCIRDIQDELAGGQRIWAKHPQDFSLFEIGDYDELTGQIELYETKNCLGLLQDFRQSLGNN